MGVKRLWNILRLFQRPYGYLVPRRRSVMVDAFNVIYAYAQNYTNENFHIAALYRVSLKLMRHGLVPIFIFDNASTFLKRETQLDRRMARARVISTEDVDLAENDDAHFFVFDQPVIGTPTFQEKILSEEARLSELIGLATEHSIVSRRTERVPSYSAYETTYSRVVDSDDPPRFDMLLQELQQFSDGQIDKIVSQHGNRTEVDFEAERLEMEFDSEQCGQIEYDLALQFQGVQPSKQEIVEPIKVQNSTFKETEYGEDVQEILDALNIPIGRTEIERSLVLFTSAMGTAYKESKTSLREKFNFLPKLTSRKIEQCRDLLNVMSLPHFTAAAGIEAEQLAANFTLNELADYVFSRDGDSLVFGANTLLFFEEEELFQVRLSDMEAAGIGRYALIYLSMLLGGDFHAGLPGIGDVALLEFLATFGPIRDEKQLISALDVTEVFITTGRLNESSISAKLHGTRERALSGRDAMQVVRQFYDRNALKLYLNGTRIDQQILKSLTETRDPEGLLSINRKYLEFCAGYSDSCINLHELLVGYGVELEESLSESVCHVLEREKANYEDIRYEMEEKHCFPPDIRGASKRVKQAISLIESTVE